MKKRHLVYKKYYDLTIRSSDYKISYYARKLYKDKYRSRHSDFINIIENMEYYGYLLYKDKNVRNEKRYLVYKKYYDLIVEDPGHKISYYARKLYKDKYRSRHSDFINIIANMEYYGYLLYEDDNRNLYPYKIIDRKLKDIHKEEVSH